MKKEKLSYWKQRPSEKSGSTIVAATDGLLKLAFDNKYMTAYANFLDKYFGTGSKLCQIPAPKCFYEWEKPTEPIKPIKVNFSSGFRGDVERYALAETLDEQKEAISMIKSRNTWFSS